MMKSTAIGILAGVIMSDSGNAQPFIGPYTNTAEQDVLGRARDGDRQAILELGRRSSQESLLVLQTLAAQFNVPADVLESQKTGIEKQDKENVSHLKRVYDKRSEAAKSALAKRGDSKSFQEILNGLESSTGEALEISIGSLGYIGNPLAAPKIAPYLFKTGTPHEVIPGGHAWTRTYAEIAAAAFGHLFPEIKIKLKKDNPNDFYLIDPWRTWWKAHEKDFGASRLP